MSAERLAATATARAGRWSDGLLLGGVGVVCFSGTAPATRVAAPVLGAATLTFSRIVIAAVLGAATLLLTGRRSWPGRARVPRLLTMGLGLAVGYPLFLGLAVDQVPAYHGAVVIGLVPAATAALAAARGGERPAPRFWLACLLGFAAVLGFAIIQGGGALHAADGWLAAAVLSCAVGYVEGARAAREIGAVPALCWAMILLAPAAVLALVLLPVPHDVPASAWAGLGYAGTMSMFAGSVAWYHGLAAGGTSRIGQLNLAQPFLGILWSGVLLGERIGWAVPATASVVLACMAVCLATLRPEGPRTRPPCS
ncbi:MAG: DMT family transporter [Actinoallomurus sp.]